MPRIVLFIWSLTLAIHSHAALIAQNDGTVTFEANLYVTGYGNLGDSNFIDESMISGLVPMGDDVIVKVTMGDYVDYYKPIGGSDLLTMLTSSTQHLWSFSHDQPFIAPNYYSSPTLLGGSAAGWPADGRVYLSFWGGTGSLSGGCCQSEPSGAQGWSQSFSIETVSEVPIPAAAWLFGSALLTLVGIKRRKSAA